MVLSCSKLPGGLLLTVTGENDLPFKSPVIVTTKRALPITIGMLLHTAQLDSLGNLKTLSNCGMVRSEEKQNLPALKTFTFSRRNMILSLGAASFSGLTLFPVEPSEARVKNPEIRRKIKEKLEKLREEAGVRKPKTGNGNESPPAEPLAREKKPSPNPQNISVGPLVQATLP